MTSDAGILRESRRCRFSAVSKGAWRHASLALAGLAFLAAVDGSARRSRPPNVVLIVVDGLRPDHLTHAGYARNTSPFLARLAAESVWFENAISQSSWTKTSVASLLTSLYPEAHGVRGTKDVVPDSIDTLPETLEGFGYETYALHGNPWLEERFGFNQGFDRFSFTDWYKETFDAQGMNNRVFQWLDERSADKPFFAYLHYMDVHSPWRPPAEFDRFGPEPVDKYDSSILYLDSRLEALFRELGSRGLAANTWLVVTADHGEEFGEHGNYKVGHGVTLYGEVLRVPLLFHHPRGSARKRVDRQVRLIDVAPTILDLLEIPVPEEMEGVSIRAEIVGSGDRPLDDLDAVSQLGLDRRSTRLDLIAFTTPRHKYVLDFQSGSEELYHLTSDPGETRNVAEAAGALLREFRAKAWRFRKIQSAKRAGTVSEGEIDRDLEQQLRALGYVN